MEAPRDTSGLARVGRTRSDPVVVTKDDSVSFTFEGEHAVTLSVTDRPPTRPADGGLAAPVEGNARGAPPQPWTSRRSSDRRSSSSR